MAEITSIKIDSNFIEKMIFKDCGAYDYIYYFVFDLKIKNDVFLFVNTMEEELKRFFTKHIDEITTTYTNKEMIEDMNEFIKSDYEDEGINTIHELWSSDEKFLIEICEYSGTNIKIKLMY